GTPRESPPARLPRLAGGRLAGAVPVRDPMARRARRALPRRLAREERRHADAEPLLDARDGGGVQLGGAEAAPARALRRAGTRRDHALARDRRAVGVARRDRDPGHDDALAPDERLHLRELVGRTAGGPRRRRG